jgi:Transposase domain (DUF772)
MQQRRNYPDLVTRPTTSVATTATNRSCCLPTCATGSPKAISPGSSWTWSTSSTSPRSTGRTATTGTAIPPTTPKLLLDVLLYAYCLGVRSSRQLERRLHEDIAFRVLAGNQTADRVTIARFHVRHEQALAAFLVQSLKLCAAAGIVQVGTVALDGTKLAANAADTANRTLDKIDAEVAEILRQAAATDQRRTSSTATPAATSCPTRWPARPAGWRGCGQADPATTTTPEEDGAGEDEGGKTFSRAKADLWLLPRTLDPRVAQAGRPRADPVRGLRRRVPARRRL